MTKSRIFLFVFFLVFSQLSHAEPTVELIWSGTSGTGSVGISNITAEVGDTLVLDIQVSGDEVGLFGTVLSLYWDAGDVTGYSAEECPSPPNFSPGLCDDSLGNIFVPLEPGVTEAAGLAEGFDTFSALIAPGYLNETMWAGRVEFIVEAQATTDIVVGYGDGEGILDGEVVVSYPAATATINSLPPCSGCGCPG